MIKNYDIGFYIKPALKLRMCIFAWKTKRVIEKDDNETVQRCDGPPETAVPGLKLYYQRTKIPPETAVPVLKLYYQRTKIQLVAGDGGSSTTREGKSSRPPKTAVPVLKLY